MINPNVIAQISQTEGIGWEIVEKDYFLTLMLEGIAQTPELARHFVFKGGTCLRKAYFRDYRYSEDLDFTLRERMDGNTLRAALDKALGYLKREHNAAFDIKGFNSKSYFTDAKVRFTGLRESKGVITLDISGDEPIIDPVVERAIFNPYYAAKISVPAYSLEEILAEKLRSLLQRTRVRDYYDIWYLLGRQRGRIDLARARQIFLKKAAYKKIVFTGPPQFLVPEKIEAARAYYAAQVKNQVRELPPFDTIISGLNKSVLSMWANDEG